MANKFLVVLVVFILSYLMASQAWLMHSVSEIKGDLKLVIYKVNENSEQLNAHSQMLGNLREEINNDI